MGCGCRKTQILFSPNAFLIIVSSSVPRNSSKTEKTSCPCFLSHCDTAGPAHSSTRKRIYAASTSGMKLVLASDLAEKKTDMPGYYPESVLRILPVFPTLSLREPADYDDGKNNTEFHRIMPDPDGLGLT